MIIYYILQDRWKQESSEMVKFGEKSSNEKNNKVLI